MRRLSRLRVTIRGLSPSNAIALLAAVLLAACGSAGAAAAPAGHAQPVGEPGRAPAAAVTPAGTVVPVGAGPEGVAVDAASGLVAVDLRSPSLVAVLDAGGHLQRTVPVPAAGRHLRFAAPGGLLLAPLEASRTLAEIDVSQGTVVARVPLGKQPHDAVAAGGRIFVSNEFSDTLAVVRGATVERVLPAPTQPGGVAATADTVAVVGVRSHVLEAFDLRTLRSRGTVPAGTGPTHLVADGSRVYEADTLGGSVRVFTTRPRPTQVAQAAAPGRPYGIALDAARHRLWVTLTARDQLAEFDVGRQTPRLLATYPTVQQPNTVAVDPRNGRVIVTGTSEGVLELFDPPAG